MRFSGQWAAKYIQNIIIRDFQTFTEVVKKRLFRVFDNIRKEALEHGEKWLEDKVRYFEMDNEGAISYYTDEAMQQTDAYEDMLVSMYFTTIGLYTIGLSHFFEQHLSDFLLFSLDVHTLDEIKINDVAEWLKSQESIDITKFSSWPIIQELRIVANTIKHAEGRSAKELRPIRSDLFIHPSQRKYCKVPESCHSRIRKPLFGEDLYLTENDFSIYAEAVLAFWSELAESMSRHR